MVLASETRDGTPAEDGDTARAAIPLEENGDDPLARLVGRHRSRLRIILASARSAYGPAALRVGDVLARQRAARLPDRFRQELAAIAEAVAEPGAWLLNFSYEWGCTTAGAPEPDGSPRLLRALDWTLPGLGRSVIAVRMRGAAGPWLNLTWPGFAGAVQAVARGRFAAAMNQAPGPRTPFGALGDWLAAKIAAWRRDGLPPVLALRDAFDTCRSFAEARRHLAEVPLCAPVLFSLVGTRPGEGALIERAVGRTVVHDGLPAVANHWLTAGLPGRSRSIATAERLAGIRAHLASRRPAAPPFGWLTAPVLNGTTRLALEAVPATGRVLARGYEPEGPATALLDVLA